MTLKRKIVKRNTLKKDKSFHSDIPIDKKYCAPCAKGIPLKKGERSCYSKDSLMKMAKAWNESHKSEKKITMTGKTGAEIWNQLNARMEKACPNNESCWKEQRFIKNLKDTEIEMYTFKPNFPKEWKINKFTWLNTYDILYVMKQYEKAYKDFMFLGPIPSDCPYKIQCELSNFDLIKMKKNNINKVGIIYNLDVSTGPGTHWVGVYIDVKNNEIDYYDSYGQMPIALIQGFIQQVVDKLKKAGYNATVIYNDKRHQYGGSECGVYSMNFVLERLHGKNMYQISKMAIPDKDMNYLRTLLFKKGT